MGPFTAIMNMKKSNKLMLKLIFLSLWGAILGGYFKISGNSWFDLFQQEKDYGISKLGSEA